MHRSRLLLIEKDCALRLMIEQHLRRFDRFDIETIDEAGQAIESAGLGQFDVILASLHLPDVPPAHLVESLSALRPRPLIIAITSGTQLQSLDAERSAMVWDVLETPFSRTELEDAVFRAHWHHQTQLCRSVVSATATKGDGEARAAGRARAVRLGQYQVSELLGEGPKGGVYRGVDQRTGEAVALRAIPSELAKRLGSGSRWFERFTREASAAAAVSHPQLTVILDHGFDEERRCLFVVYELARGTRLAELLEAGPLEPAAALEMARAVSSALSAVHSGGFAHRLVRPTNIMIDGGDAVLTDVGLAGMLAWDLMPRPRRRDVSPYQSPEQLRLGRVDDRSDQFSLGLVLHGALTGRHAFDGDSPDEQAHHIATGKPRLAIDDSLPGHERLREVLGKMLARSPDARYQGDIELLAALQSCADELK